MNTVCVRLKTNSTHSIEQMWNKIELEMAWERINGSNVERKREGINFEPTSAKKVCVCVCTPYTMYTMQAQIPTKKKNNNTNFVEIVKMKSKPGKYQLSHWWLANYAKRIVKIHFIVVLLHSPFPLLPLSPRHHLSMHISSVNRSQLLSILLSVLLIILRCVHKIVLSTELETCSLQYVQLQKNK